MKKIPDGYIILPDVVAMAHASAGRVRSDIRKGRLAVYKIPAQKAFLFRREDVDAYIERYHTPKKQSAVV